jgi:predicted DCC family thiol-disulfide oxidoreductase YuxK
VTVQVIFDGDCGFCIRSLRVCRALDWRHRLGFHDSHDRRRIDALFPQLRAADFENAMFAVDAAGRAYRGFFAFRRIAWETPLLWLMLPVLYFPGSTAIGPRVYAWIARNRHRLGCGSTACALPPAAPLR